MDRPEWLSVTTVKDNAPVKTLTSDSKSALAANILELDSDEVFHRFKSFATKVDQITQIQASEA